MLKKAIISGGEEIDKELADQLEVEKRQNVQMNEKQRMQCWQLVQAFFGGLGDPKEKPLAEIETIVENIRQKNEIRKKEETKVQREQIRKEHEVRQKQLHGLSAN